MKKMKICFTTNSSPWTKFHGGGQIFVHNVAEKLSSKGHQVTVIYTGPGVKPSSGIPACGYRVEWAMFIGYPWTAKFRQLNSITVYNKLKSLKKKSGFDVVNSVGSESLFIPGFCRPRKIPFFVSIEHPALYSIRPVCKVSSPVRSLLSILRARELAAIKYACRRADGIITPSDFTKAEVVKYFGVGGREISVIYHGLNEDMLVDSPEPCNHNVSGPLLFFGRLEPQKGVDLLINAYYRLVKEEIISGQKLIIIGDGPYADVYRKMTQDLGLKERVTFSGWLPSAGIKKHLQGSSLCVLPSRSESFGLTMVEALSLGTPLVTTQGGSIPEVVDNENGAWLARMDDTESLFEVIRMAVENYEESLKRAGHGQKHVKEHFSWHKAAREYEQFYLEIINRA